MSEAPLYIHPLCATHTLTPLGRIGLTLLRRRSRDLSQTHIRVVQDSFHTVLDSFHTVLDSFHTVLDSVLASLDFAQSRSGDLPHTRIRIGLTLLRRRSRDLSQTHIRVVLDSFQTVLDSFHTVLDSVLASLDFAESTPSEGREHHVRGQRSLRLWAESATPAGREHRVRERKATRPTDSRENLCREFRVGKREFINYKT